MSYLSPDQITLIVLSLVSIPCVTVLIAITVLAMRSNKK